MAKDGRRISRIAKLFAIEPEQRPGQPPWMLLFDSYSSVITPVFPVSDNRISFFSLILPIFCGNEFARVIIDGFCVFSNL